MNRKKIAYVNFHFFDTDVTVVKELQKVYDVEWYVILREKDEGYTKEFFQNFVRGTNIHLYLYKYSFRRRDIRFLLLLFRIMVNIRKEKASLIYTSCSENLYLQLALLLFTRRKPIVYGIHDVKRHSSTELPSLPERLGEYLLFKFGKYFFTFSINQHELFSKLYGNKKCFMVGMSSKNYGISNLKLPDKSEGTRFLMFGAMDTYKGYDLLIVAFEKLVVNTHNANYSKSVLSLYGRVKDNDLKFIEDNTIHKANYNLHLEFVENDVIKDIYSTNHFAVMPYRDATQSGPLMIAINYGVPVIAPKFGIFNDILSQDNSILYDPNDVDGLYKSLKLASEMSQEQYLKLRKESEKLKEEYSEEIIGRHYVLAFNSILCQVK